MRVAPCACEVVRGAAVRQTAIRSIRPRTDRIGRRGGPLFKHVISPSYFHCVSSRLAAGVLDLFSGTGGARHRSLSAVPRSRSSSKNPSKGAASSATMSRPWACRAAASSFAEMRRGSAKRAR